MNEIQTTDKLTEIFNLPENSSTNEEQNDSALVKVEKSELIPFEDIEEEKVVDVQLQNLTVKANEMLDVAKYRLETSPDAETIDAVAKLIKSTADVLSELNKSLLVKKEYDYKRELELMKINAKKELAILNGKTKAVPSISGNNNSVTVQNNLVQFSTEEIVKQILKSKNKDVQTVEATVIEQK